MGARPSILLTRWFGQVFVRLLASAFLFQRQNKILGGDTSGNAECNPKYFCRKCRNKISIVDLKSIARRELKSFFGQPERIAGHSRKADQNLTEKSALLDTHRRETQKVKEEMQ